MADDKEVLDKEIVDKEGSDKDTNVVTLSEDEQRAVNLGWKPKDQWQGDETSWVPATWWLKFGDVEQRAIALEHQDKQKDKVIAAMKNHYMRVKEDAVREVIDTIKRQKAAAIKEEDFQKVAELDVQADMLQRSMEGKFSQRDREVEQEQQVEGPPPEFYVWNKNNSWYKLGSNTDEMTKEADRLAIGFKNQNPNASYTEILTYAEDRIKKIFPKAFEKEPLPNTMVDDGGSEHATPTRKSKGYQLNEAERAAAKAFGIDEAEYAKELQAYDKRKGLR